MGKRDARGSERVQRIQRGVERNETGQLRKGSGEKCEANECGVRGMSVALVKSKNSWGYIYISLQLCKMIDATTPFFSLFGRFLLVSLPYAF
jgi:hypothetical protein